MGITANLIPSTIEHAEHIARTVRPADRDELWASMFKTPFESMKMGLSMSSHVMTGCADDDPVVMWGVVRGSDIPNVGLPWLVASSRLDERECTVKFLRKCREPLVEFMREYDMLINYVDARNVRAIRWLKYMGFVVEDEAKPYGVMRYPFHKFYMKGS